ncbi:6-O-methylguanine DNA methyltransferase [bacterium SCGC AG-212-C10]|nr:6-O-methylguanine DNA methyltransferase [bacterium SCGC AG-212-C10]
MATMTADTHTTASGGTTSDPRWQAVVSRDHAADGTFVYAVRTTRIFCRPSCPSRAALPKNVSFFDTCTDAEAAGYRACQRCRPNASPLADRNAAVIVEACRAIEAAESELTLDDLAATAGMSASYFHRQFKSVTGLTPKAYAAAQRAQKVRDELGEATGTVTDAIFGAGYNSSGRFYKRSTELLGMRPTAYRDGGRDAEIRFALGECSLGTILVARSDKGVCAILFGDDPEALARDLQDRFPRANLIGGDAAFEETVAAVVGFVEAPQVGLDLPLDIRGTAFQERVWQALREIPAGTTASYSDVAARMGAPKSVRAVAQACAANKLAVAIPCHRVVRTDGDLSGYRWGVERKRALLEREAAR